MSTGLVQILVQFGIPSAVIGAIGYMVDAIRKSRALRRAAPQEHIDTSMNRMQQAAIVQDQLLDNLQEALGSANARADAAESRERASTSRFEALEAQLAEARAKLIEVTDKLAATSQLLEDLRGDIPPATT